MVTPFCNGGASGAHQKGVNDEEGGSAVEVVDGEELRWPAVCTRWSYIFTRTLGCVWHNRTEETGGWQQCLPRRGQQQSRGVAAGKSLNVGNSVWLCGCDDFEEYDGASVHLLGNSMEDRRKQSGLSPVSPSSSSNGYGRLCAGGKKKKQDTAT
jgi:hypothetical protein